MSIYRTFVPLGYLTDAQKKVLWKERIGGSKFAKILDPVERLEEYHRMTNPNIPAKEIQAWTEDGQKTLEEKLYFGNTLENVIIEELRRRLNLGDRLVIDKRTFYIVDLEYCDANGQALLTFNIDAFIISQEGYDAWLAKKITDEERIYYVERVVEGKNTEKDDTYLKNMYRPQTFYYSWGLNATKPPWIVYLRNGCHFGIIEFTEEDWRENTKKYIDDGLFNFIECIRNHRAPELSIPVIDDTQIVPNIKTAERTMIKKYESVLAKANKFKEEAKTLKENILSISDKSYNIWDFKQSRLVADGYETIISRRNGSKKKDYQHTLEVNNVAYIKARRRLKEECGIDLDQYLTYKSEPFIYESDPFLVLAVKKVNSVSEVLDNLETHSESESPIQSQTLSQPIPPQLELNQNQQNNQPVDIPQSNTETISVAEQFQDILGLPTDNVSFSNSLEYQEISHQNSIPQQPNNQSNEKVWTGD